MAGRAYDFLVRECPGNLVRTFTVNGHLEDAPYNLRGGFVDEPVVMIIRIFAISVNSLIRKRLAAVTLGVQDGFDFLGCVPCVKFRYNVPKRREVVIVADIVHAVADSDKPNPALAEHLHVQPDTEIITLESVFVLADYGADVTRLNLGKHSLPSWSLKICSCKSVVKHTYGMVEAVFRGKVGEDFFLVGYGIALAVVKTVIARKPAIEYIPIRCDAPVAERLPNVVHIEPLSGNQSACGIVILPHFAPTFNSFFIIRKILSSNDSAFGAPQNTLTVYAVEPTLCVNPPTRSLGLIACFSAIVGSLLKNV
jgi:hypothetical protein